MVKSVSTERNLALSYIAGFFDGEGSVSFAMYKNKGTRHGYSFNPNIGIYQNDKNVLDWIQKMLQFGMVNRFSKEPEHFVYYVNRQKDVEKFCELLLPLVKVKRPQLKLLYQAVQFMTQKPEMPTTKGISKYSFEDVAKLAEMSYQMSKLNNGLENKKNFPKDLYLVNNND